MNTELKAKWIEALRSGKYTQAQGMLRDGGCFCCLGVLCDLVKPTGWNSDGEFIYGDDDHDDGVNTTLPIEMNREFEVDFQEESKLVRMNDNGSTFAEIADYIEAHL